MGLVTGVTQNKLALVKSYDPVNPYIVGVNGVTDVTYGGNGNLETVKYSVDNIDYVTTMRSNDYVVLNEPRGSKKSFIPSTQNGFASQPPLTPTSLTTTFSYQTQLKEESSFFVFKSEELMGVVFSPKIYDEIFIERQTITIFEQQARLSEIHTLGELVDYKDGIYNVRNIE